MTVTVRGSVLPDAIDLRILRALQLEPRAPFAELGAVLGLSEVTVARRYRRMTRDGVLRVTGTVDVAALGRSRWWVRMRCRPEAAGGIASALAARDDVPWIGLGGPGEITCAIGSRDHAARDDLLGTRLPRTRAVLSIETSMVLHRFEPPIGASTTLGAVLTPAEEAALVGSAARTGLSTEAPSALEDHDEALIHALSIDGRTGFADLAGTSGLTPGRVARRIRVLSEHRILRTAAEIAAPAVGIQAPALLHLRVHPGRVRDVGEALIALPEVTAVDAVSGRRNLICTVLCRDLEELFDLTVDRVGSLPGVEDLEVSPVLQQVKQGGLRLQDGLLAPPVGGHGLG